MVITHKVYYSNIKFRNKKYSRDFQEKLARITLFVSIYLDQYFLQLISYLVSENPKIEKYPYFSKNQISRFGLQITVSMVN